MNKYIDKEIVNKKIEEIRFGLKIKSHEQILIELDTLKELVNSYRQPYECSTCKEYPCQSYASGCRNCGGWK